MEIIEKLTMMVLFVCITGHPQDVHGDALQSATDALLSDLQSTSMDTALFWNLVAIKAAGNDHDKSITAGPEQPGPGCSSRALAIVHGAMYEALNAFHQISEPVYAVKDLPSTSSVPLESNANAAMMEAAYQTLCSLYPKQEKMFDDLRNVFAKTIENTTETGITIGSMIAFAVLKDRATDGSQSSADYVPTMKPGYHRADPTHPKQAHNAPHWGHCKPFIIDSVKRFRSSNILGTSEKARMKFLSSKTYLKNHQEVKSIGARNSTIRTADQTEIGIFWAYDGAPKLGAPPRLYNQVTRAIAIQRNNTLVQNARLFALVNYALADTGFAAWETKYYYNFWRPIVGIREGTPCTPADPEWLPLGAPADGNKDNFTPAFPSYISGHASFGSAMFEIIRRFYETDQIPFSFQSDEFNGKTFDSITQTIRPPKTRQYRSLTHAETENLLSRIYLGVHWRMDQTHGLILGRRVAKYVYNQLN